MFTSPHACAIPAGAGVRFCLKTKLFTEKPLKFKAQSRYTSFSTFQRVALISGHGQLLRSLIRKSSALEHSPFRTNFQNDSSSNSSLWNVVSAYTPEVVIAKHDKGGPCGRTTKTDSCQHSICIVNQFPTGSYWTQLNIYYCHTWIGSCHR